MQQVHKIDGEKMCMYTFVYKQKFKTLYVSWKFSPTHLSLLSPPVDKANSNDNLVTLLAFLFSFIGQAIFNYQLSAHLFQTVFSFLIYSKFCIFFKDG